MAASVITIVGSRDLWPIPVVASAVLDIMLRHEGEVFCVRANRRNELASGTEDLVERIGARLNMNVLPWPSADGANSAFHRDNAMVNRCWSVHAFFSPGALMEGGTGHVAAVALRQGKQLTAYSVNDDGRVFVVAEDEGDLLRMYRMAE